MALEQKDIELLERVIYKNSDDVAVSIARSFERLSQQFLGKCAAAHLQCWNLNNLPTRT